MIVSLLFGVSEGERRWMLLNEDGTYQGWLPRSKFLRNSIVQETLTPYISSLVKDGVS